MKISENKAIAVLQLFFGGMTATLFFGILSLMLWCVSGGLGAVLIPILVYFGVRFAEKWRERYKAAHSVGSALFILVSELPSVIVSGVLFLLLMGNSEGGDILDIAGELIGAAISAFWCGVALLIMLGTVICSIVIYHTRKKTLSQLTAAEETTEVQT